MELWSIISHYGNTWKIKGIPASPWECQEVWLFSLIDRINEKNKGPLSFETLSVQIVVHSEIFEGSP